MIVLKENIAVFCFNTEVVTCLVKTDLQEEAACDLSQSSLTGTVVTTRRRAAQSAAGKHFVWFCASLFAVENGCLQSRQSTVSFIVSKWRIANVTAKH